MAAADIRKRRALLGAYAGRHDALVTGLGVNEQQIGIGFELGHMNSYEFGVVCECMAVLVHPLDAVVKLKNRIQGSRNRNRG
jgi:hypothetical protein